MNEPKACYQSLGLSFAASSPQQTPTNPLRPLPPPPCTLEMAAKPLGTSANFRPADGLKYPGNLPVILRPRRGGQLHLSAGSHVGEPLLYWGEDGRTDFNAQGMLQRVPQGCRKGCRKQQDLGQTDRHTDRLTDNGCFLSCPSPMHCIRRNQTTNLPSSPPSVLNVMAREPHCETISTHVKAQGCRQSYVTRDTETQHSTLTDRHAACPHLAVGHAPALPMCVVHRGGNFRVKTSASRRALSSSEFEPNASYGRE